MKNKSLYFIAILLIGSTIHLKAQQVNTSKDSLLKSESRKPTALVKQPFNFFKINLTGLILKNFSFQYERVLSKKISVAIGYRTMPSGTIPFKNSVIKNIAGNEPDSVKAKLEKLRFSNFAITPEVRIYLSKKGYGHGFYVAPFYRYASYTLAGITFNYEGSPGNNGSVAMSGTLTSHTAGILLGLQQNIGKYVCLDLWLVGPQYGAASGDFSGVSSVPIDAAGQADLKRRIDDISLPFTTKTVNVSANGANLKLDGGWGGMRAGLCVGVRF